jgi:hypothetical protein
MYEIKSLSESNGFTDSNWRRDLFFEHLYNMFKGASAQTLENKHQGGGEIAIPSKIVQLSVPENVGNPTHMSCHGGGQYVEWEYRIEEYVQEVAVLVGISDKLDDIIPLARLHVPKTEGSKGFYTRSAVSSFSESEENTVTVKVKTDTSIGGSYEVPGFPIGFSSSVGSSESYSSSYGERASKSVTISMTDCSKASRCSQIYLPYKYCITLWKKYAHPTPPALYGQNNPPRLFDIEGWYNRNGYTQDAGFEIMINILEVTGHPSMEDLPENDDACMNLDPEEVEDWPHIKLSADGEKSISKEALFTETAQKTFTEQKEMSLSLSTGLSLGSVEMSRAQEVCRSSENRVTTEVSLSKKMTVGYLLKANDEDAYFYYKVRETPGWLDEFFYIWHVSEGAPLTADGGLEWFSGSDGSIPNYIGNKSSMEVHTLECSHGKNISARHAVAIGSLINALKTGYNGCYYCMPDYDTDVKKTVVCNKRSKEIHKPDCEWAGKIDADNKAEFQTIGEAVSNGYNGCYYCLREINTG